MILHSVRKSGIKKLLSWTLVCYQQHFLSNWNVESFVSMWTYESSKVKKNEKNGSIASKSRLAVMVDQLQRKKVVLLGGPPTS